MAKKDEEVKTEPVTPVVTTPVVIEPVVAPKKPEEKPVEADVPKKPEVVAPKIDKAEDDDIAFLKGVFQKQMIDSLDIETLKRFTVECEGKNLKTKAEWISKNKPISAPDPSKGLPKGPSGGRPLGRYDEGYKHQYVDNRPKTG